MRSTAILLSVLAAFGLALAPAALGQIEPRKIAALAPADVDVLIAADSVSTARRTPIGRTVRDLAGSVGMFDRIGPAWSELAGALGQTDEEAFDDLLGERVLYTARWDADGMASWALMSWVKPRVADRVRTRLKAAPRDVLGGRAVLTIDGGRLSVLLGPREGGRRALLIGPTDRRSLFEETALGMSDGLANPLVDAPRFESIRSLGKQGDALILGRFPEEGGLWLGVLANRKRDAIELGFLLGVPGMHIADEGRRTWSKRTFDTLADGAFAVVLDQNDLGDAGGDASPIPLPIPNELTALMGDRWGFVVRPADEGPIEIAATVETLDLTEMAREGDEMVGRLVSRLPAGATLAQRVGSFRRAPASAIRTLDLREHVPQLGEFGWTTGPRLSWRGRPSNEPCDPGQTPGWWTVGLGTTAVDDLAAAMLAEPDPISMPWLSLGVVRPHATLRALADAGAPVPEGLAPLQRVGEIRWEALRLGHELIGGTGRLAMAPLESGGDNPAMDEMAGYREGRPEEGAVAGERRR